MGIPQALRVTHSLALEHKHQPTDPWRLNSQLCVLGNTGRASQLASSPYRRPWEGDALSAHGHHAFGGPIQEAQPIMHGSLSLFS